MYGACPVPPLVHKGNSRSTNLLQVPLTQGEEIRPLENDPAAGPAGLLAMGSHLK